MSRVAIYGAGGAPFNHAAVLAHAGNEVIFVFPPDIVEGVLDGVDAFVMPGGGYAAMQGQLDPLGEEGIEAIRAFVAGGGMYIGSCAGAYDAATTPDEFLAVCPLQERLRLTEARVWNGGPGMFGVIRSPGIGELVVANAAPNHPVMAGLPSTFDITHYNGPLFVGGGTPLTIPIAVTSRFTPAEQFLGEPDGADGLIDRAIDEGVANATVDRFGEGRVVLFGSHPEFGTSVALDDIGIAATMLQNAVAWQADERSRRTSSTSPAWFERPVDPDRAAADRAGLPATVARIEAAVARLVGRESARWLQDDEAMSLLGLSAETVWSHALERIPALAAEAASADLPDAVLAFRPDPSWPVDGGFWGVAPLLQQAAEMLEDAAAAPLDATFPATDGYEHMRDSPYHLVAGSYLAAVGRAAGAALLARAFALTPAVG